MRNEKLWFLLALGAIGILGVFLRTVSFGEGLIFQSDQSRDALIVLEAEVNGIEHLPLVGPQARGSALHLGPIFYYFQYLSVKVFGMSPEALAFPDLIFGILTLPLLFCLLRKFVSDPIALGVTLMGSVSFFLITFSRFAWNPNSLAFFSTLFAVLLVQFLAKETRRWPALIGLSVCVGVILQLHFVAALSLVLALGIFLLMFRPLLWREFFVALAIVVAIQTPTLLSEMRTHGAMTEAFLETVGEKGTQDRKHGLHEKIFRMYQSQSQAFFLMATGRPDTSLILTRGWHLRCDDDCQERLPETLMALLFFSALLLTSVSYAKTCRGDTRALAFFGLWFLSFSVVMTLVAYQISTRFYLSITPLFFVFFAFSLAWLQRSFGRKLGSGLVPLLLLLFVVLNVEATTTYLGDLKKSQSSRGETREDLVFGGDGKVTLSQLRNIASDIHARVPAPEPIIISGESRYVRSVYYLLFVEQGRTGCYIKGTQKEPLPSYHVIVTKNKGQRDATAFGTLATQFVAPQVGALVPGDCITY